MVKLISISSVIVLLFAVLYVGISYLRAWLSVKAAPKTEMNWCPRHGPVRKEDMITFLDVPYCPLCFHQKLSEAERNPEQFVNGVRNIL